MCNKYETIKKCKKCTINIKPNCDEHKYLLLEEFTQSQLEEMNKLKNEITELKKKLNKIKN